MTDLTAITFDPSIGYGSIITIGLMVSGFIGSWYTLKTQFKEAIARHIELDSKVSRIDLDLQAHKLHTSESFVRRDDIEKLEERLGRMFNGLIEGIGKRLDTVEHTARNIDTKILSIVQMTGRKRGNDE